MKKAILPILMILYFGFGGLSGIFFYDYITQSKEYPSSTDITSTERPSPYDHIKEDKIRIYDNKVEITMDRDISWARFAASNSMDPVLDETANSIEIIPKSTDDVHVGDIVAFDYKGSLIVHRVKEIGYDNDGWYAVTGGDNVQANDVGKRRFSDIKYVTVAIIY